MSSPLSSARCLSVTGTLVAIRLEPQQALTLPYSDAFALALVYEPLGGIVYASPGRRWPRPVRGPLGDAVRADLGGTDRAVDDAFSGGADRDALLAVARRYVRCEGYRDPAGALVPAGCAPDPAGLFRPTAPRAPVAVSRALVRAFDDHWVARVGTAPAITLLIAATDPRWLAHLAPGMLWDSYVFDDDAPSFP